MTEQELEYLLAFKSPAPHGYNLEDCEIADTTHVIYHEQASPKENYNDLDTIVGLYYGQAPAVGDEVTNPFDKSSTIKIVDVVEGKILVSITK